MVVYSTYEMKHRNVREKTRLVLKVKLTIRVDRLHLFRGNLFVSLSKDYSYAFAQI